MLLPLFFCIFAYVKVMFIVFELKFKVFESMFDVFKLKFKDYEYRVS